MRLSRWWKLKWWLRRRRNININVNVEKVSLFFVIVSVICSVIVLSQFDINNGMATVDMMTPILAVLFFSLYIHLDARR